MAALKRGEASVRGTLSSDPLARLLAGLVSEAATGTLQLTLPDGSVAQALLVQGQLSKIKTPTPLYLGSILYELGLVGAEELNASLLDVAKSKKLHGAVLCDKGQLRERQLFQALSVQAGRKLHELFAAPGETVFEFFPYHDALATFGGSDGPQTDLRPCIWYGIRACPPMWHVKAVLSAAENVRFRLSAAEDPKTLGFNDDEMLVVETFRGRARTVAELTCVGAADQKKRELVLYFLLLSGSLARESSPPKQVESGVRSRIASPIEAMPDPELAAKIFERAYVVSQSGKHELAETLCRRGLESDPANVNLSALRVWLRATAPDGLEEAATQRAIADLSAIVGAHDECAHAHFFRGQLYKRLGRHERAASDFRETLQHDPRRADAQAELRLCVTRLRKQA